MGVGKNWSGNIRKVFFIHALQIDSLTQSPTVAVLLVTLFGSSTKLGIFSDRQICWRFLNCDGINLKLKHIIPMLYFESLIPTQTLDYYHVARFIKYPFGTSKLILAPLDYLFSFLRLVIMSLTISRRELIMFVLPCHNGSGSMTNPIIFPIPLC